KAFESFKPDLIFSEDVSCLTSYIHYAVARGHGIPFWRIGSARMPGLLSVYSEGLQDWNLTKAKLRELDARPLSAEEKDAAQGFVNEFREKPQRPRGMKTRATLALADKKDFSWLLTLWRRRAIDGDNPTLDSPWSALLQRMRRLFRSWAADAFGYF